MTRKDSEFSDYPLMNCNIHLDLQLQNSPPEFEESSNHYCDTFDTCDEMKFDVSVPFQRTDVGFDPLNVAKCSKSVSIPDTSDYTFCRSNRVKENNSDTKFMIPDSSFNQFDNTILFRKLDFGNRCVFSDLCDQYNSNQNNDTKSDCKFLIDDFTKSLKNVNLEETVSVINLSNRVLSDTKISVLSLGKEFCPTPGEPNMGEIRSDLDRFHNNCRKTIFFSKDVPKPSRDHGANNTINLSSSTPNLQVVPHNTSNVLTEESFKKKLLREKLFKKSSTWIPPKGPPNFEAFALLNELAVGKEPIRAPNRSNISLTGRACLKKLAIE